MNDKMTHCPLIDKLGQPIFPGVEASGKTHWNADLPDVCIVRCFNAGHDEAERRNQLSTRVVTSVTDDEREATDGETGSNTGILAEDRTARLGIIETADGEETILDELSFSFQCLVEARTEK